MKKLLTMMDEWAAKAIRFIRPARHNSPNVLTDNIHLKEKQVPFEEGDKEDIKPFIIRDDTYLTREGQMIRNPLERKRTIRQRSKYRKGT